MGQLTDMIERFKRINVRDSVRRGFLNCEKEFVNLVIDQLKHGLDSGGEPIGEYRDDQYAFEKHAMNPLPGLGIMDFRFSGAFYRGIFVTLKGDAYTVTSIDPKAPKLEIIAREPIYLLMPKNKEYFVNAPFKTAVLRDMKFIK